MNQKPQLLQLQKIIGKGLKQLISLQKESGGFDENVFSTSIILMSLRNQSSNNSANKIIKNGLLYLKDQKSSSWTWNYIDRQTNASQRYPDDLDDTACALSCLALFDPTYLNGEAFSHILTTLIQSETAPGGPYETWLLNSKMDPRWKDTDIGVNTNIAYFLQCIGIELPNIHKYILDRLKKKDLSSLYYFSPLSLLYFISRTYHDKELTTLIQHQITLIRSEDLNSLEVALFMLTSLRIGLEPIKLETEILFLIRELEKGASSHPFYIEQIKNNRITYSGSKAITAALIIEALTEYKIKIELLKEKNSELKSESPALLLERKILSEFKNHFSYSKEMSSKIEKIIQTVSTESMLSHIVLLPYLFNNSLRFPTTANEELLTQLGKANLAGWIAYMIYDDLMDNEGDPSLLPIANTCLRIVSSTYISQFASPLLFERIMRNMEEANIDEHMQSFLNLKTNILSWKKLPVYENVDSLANKSFGHALGPLYLLEQHGLGAASQAFKGTQTFFEHYIAARQMNDDAHDWLLDLKRGFINSSSSLLLKKWQRKNKKEINLNLPSLELQKIFWNDIMPTVISAIRKHIRQAKKGLEEANKFVKADYGLLLLYPIEMKIEEAFTERNTTLEFLESYTSTNL